MSNKRTLGVSDRELKWFFGCVYAILLIEAIQIGCRVVSLWNKL